MNTSTVNESGSTLPPDWGNSSAASNETGAAASVVDEADDAIWILTSTFIIFTMQSGVQKAFLWILFVKCLCWWGMGWYDSNRDLFFPRMWAFEFCQTRHKYKPLLFFLSWIFKFWTLRLWSRVTVFWIHWACSVFCSSLCPSKAVILLQRQRIYKLANALVKDGKSHKEGNVEEEGRNIYISLQKPQYSRVFCVVSLLCAQCGNPSALFCKLKWLGTTMKTVPPRLCRPLTEANFHQDHEATW